LYGTSNGSKISEALIDNIDNKIIIYVAEDMPCITKASFFTQIRLEVPSEANIYPASGNLSVDFELAIGTPNPEAIYTVYPRGENESSSNARVYTVDVRRGEQPPDPPEPLDPNGTAINPIPAHE
jgi:hypothetical protein